ncbi:MAG TPA: metallophosphoesterase [Clostridia bacterium]|nr:metallophosphoesterase [Clostridia bacterium]
MRYYVVADVHGFYTELIDALTEKGFFEDKGPKKLIVCGDLFDRGSEAKRLETFICDLIEKDEVILIRGNHEDLTVELIENISRWMTWNIINTHHWSNRTVETVLQLTDMDLASACAQPEILSGKMKETPFYKKILPSMLDYYETANYIFVHGWIPTDSLRLGGSYVYFYRDDWRNASKAEWDNSRWINGMLAARQGVIEKRQNNCMWTLALFIWACRD